MIKNKKKCRICERYLTAITKNFFAEKRGKYNLGTICKKCSSEYLKTIKEKRSEYGKEYREKNKEKISERKKIYYQNNKEKKKEYRENNKEIIRTNRKRYYRSNLYFFKERRLKKDFNLSKNDYELIIKKQDYKCDICKILINSSFSEKKENIACVDHNHITGNVRGFLCSKCNSAIGFLNDDINLLQNAINYIKRFDNYDNKN